MKILNIGSLNLDYTYVVSHFVRAGETLASLARQKHCGGKGLNQSIAAARAGAEVFHAGQIGPEGSCLKELLAESGADVSLVDQGTVPTGHAIIQVNPEGQNCILIFGGANRQITQKDVDRYLLGFSAGDILLVQNETSCVEYAIERAAQKGMTVALNPSPISPELVSSPVLRFVNLFILNEVEGLALTEQQEPEKICASLREKYGNCHVMLTLGAQGSVFYDGRRFLHQDSFRVNAVDTTGAGDTFTGYFLSGLASGMPTEDNLRRASLASALAVSKPGAAAGIPSLSEVEAALEAKYR